LSNFLFYFNEQQICHNFISFRREKTLSNPTTNTFHFQS